MPPNPPRPLSAALRHVGELFDPRGRINRMGLLVVAAALLVLELVAGALVLRAGLDIAHPAVIGFKVLCLWLATAAVIKRLHDLDRGAMVLVTAAAGVVLWSLLATVVLMIALGPAALDEGEPGFMMSLAATVLPVFAMTMWLHCAPGRLGPNRYGPAPMGYGSARHVSAAVVPRLSDFAAGGTLASH
ncbi:MAG: DUF805 domain-containing protein [Hyphomicrobium sp.]